MLVIQPEVLFRQEGAHLLSAVGTHLGVRGGGADGIRYGLEVLILRFIRQPWPPCRQGQLRPLLEPSFRYDDQGIRRLLGFLLLLLQAFLDLEVGNIDRRYYSISLFLALCALDLRLL